MPQFPHTALLVLAVAIGCRSSDPNSARTGAPAPRAAAPVEPLDLRALLEADPERFGDILGNADAHRLKLELAIVDESGPEPRLVRSALSFGPEYVYPASSIKTCAAIAALIEMRRLAEETGAPIGPDSPLRFHALFPGEVARERDPSHVDGGTITLAHDAAKVFLVSDNAAFNRLYEFAGVDSIRALMRGAGLESCRVVHRLSEFRSREDQLRLPAIDVLSMDQGAVLARIPARTDEAPDSNAGMSGVAFGVAHVVGDERREGPMDFTHKNYMAPRDLLDMNVMLARPDIDVRGGFPLHPEDRALIAARMASTPGASVDPIYDAIDFPDDWSKPLGPGLWRLRAHGEIEIRDKVGRAYGFSLSNAYVRDARTGREFFLTAVLYTNSNGVVGDGVYGYERADRFLADLGEAVGVAVLGR